MPPTPSINSNRVPSWIVMIGSILITGHLLAVLVLVIAARSGPWPTPMGPDIALEPWFAAKLSEYTSTYYLQPLKLYHNYHFNTSRLNSAGVYFEAKVKDASGHEIIQLKFPDDNANFWVRHRQRLLAEGLGNDQPVQPQMGESVAAPNQQVRKVKIWEPVDGKQNQGRLKEVDEHLVPRDRPVAKAGEWTLLLVSAYARHLGRQHDATTVEIIRHSQEPLPPAALLVDLPGGAFDELTSNFGNIPTGR